MVTFFFLPTGEQDAWVGKEVVCPPERFICSEPSQSMRTYSTRLSNSLDVVTELSKLIKSAGIGAIISHSFGDLDDLQDVWIVSVLQITSYW